MKERIPYSPVLATEQDKSLLKIIEDRTGKKLSELPVSVAKTVILCDFLEVKRNGNFAHLDTADKFRIAGHAFWGIEGKFDLVKTYLGESEGPKWESLLEQVWERDDLVDAYDTLVKEEEFLDTILGINPLRNKPQAILFVAMNIREKRAQGLTEEEIEKQKESIIKKTKYLISKPEKIQAIEDLLEGVNYHDIHREYGIDRNELRAIRRDLFNMGIINLGLNEKDLGVLRRRDKGVSNKIISKRTGIPYNEVNRIAADLLLMGLIDPLSKMAGEQAKKTRLFYDKIVDLDREGLSTIEIARELNEFYHKLKFAKGRLRKIGEITSKPINKVSDKRKEEAEERQRKIKEALKDPTVKVEDLPLMIPDLTVAQAKRNFARLIRKGELLPRRENRKLFLKTELKKRMREHLKMEMERMREQEKTTKKKNFPFWKFVTEFKTDFNTALSIYEQIEKEEEVPLIRRRALAKQKEENE